MNDDKKSDKPKDKGPIRLSGMVYNPKPPGLLRPDPPVGPPRKPSS